MTITATLTASDPVGSQADGSIAYLLIENAPSFDVSPKPSDTLDFSPAGERLAPTIESPSPGGCGAGVSFNPMSDGTARLQVTGVDQGSATDCATFVSKVHSDGITLTYDSVNYLNGGNAKVHVKLGY